MLANYEIYYYLELNRLHEGMINDNMMEEVWKMAINMYTDSMNESIDINDEIDRIKVHNWLRNESRLPLLNDLIKDVVNRLSNIEDKDGYQLNNMDTFLLKNTSLFMDIIYKEKDYILNSMSSNLCNIPKITMKEVNNILKDILLEIDSTGEWLEIYVNAIKSNHIIYLNVISEKALKKLKQELGILGIDNIDNTCLNLGSKDRYLFLNYKGDLSDIVLTMHELIHYINEYLDNGRDVNPTMREFPSIFYELYTLKYLSKLGYNTNEIMSVYYNRQLDTYASLIEVEDIIYYLNLYIEGGQINSIIDIDRCDNCIKKLINRPYSLFNCYPYVTGHYLARQALNKSDEDKILLSIIKYATENLSKVNQDDLFILLDNDDTKIKKREIVR